MAAIVLLFLLGGAISGMFLRGVLPEHHLSDGSKDIVRLATGRLATLAALVLGLLIAAAKGSYDVKNDEIKQGAAKIILLDRSLRQYGPDAEPIRAVLREGVGRLNMDRIEDSLHASANEGTP